MSRSSRRVRKGQWTQSQLDSKLQAIRESDTGRYSFEGAILCNLVIENITFFATNFRNTNLAGATLRNVHFLGKCLFENTCMVGCKFENVKADIKNGLILSPKKAN